jgi:hypothetical protein
MWQPRAYKRSCELSSVVERAHSNIACKTKGWVEHEIRHAPETREPYSQFRRRSLAGVQTEMAGDVLADARSGKNGRHALAGLFRQSVFGRLAGYEEVNERMAEQAPF